MSPSKETTRSRPCDLAWYMARSASRSRSPPGPRAVATPIDARTVTTCPPRSTGVRSASSIRCATSTASRSSVSPSINTENSSPPSRAAVSPARNASDSRAATAISSSSPRAWPSESLIVLKPSRSRNNTPTAVPERDGPLLGLPQPVHEQRAVRQLGQRVVQRTVHRVRVVVRVRQRQRGVLGERHHRLALVDAVEPRAPRSDGEHAARLAVAQHRRGHHALEPFGREERVRRVLVDAELGRQRPDQPSAADPGPRRVVHTASGREPQHAVVEQAQRDDVAADELARPVDDRLQQRVEVGALDDRALDLREPFQQPLAGAERVHELERPDGLRERLRHPAQQRRLLHAERLALPRQGDPAAVEGGVHAGQLAEPGHERAGDAPVRRGRLARGEAQRRHDLTVADDHAGLGLERLRGPVQARPHRRRHLLTRAELRRDTP